MHHIGMIEAMKLMHLDCHSPGRIIWIAVERKNAIRLFRIVVADDEILTVFDSDVERIS